MATNPYAPPSAPIEPEPARDGYPLLTRVLRALAALTNVALIFMPLFALFAPPPRPPDFALFALVAIVLGGPTLASVTIFSESRVVTWLAATINALVAAVLIYAYARSAGVGPDRQAAIALIVCGSIVVVNLLAMTATWRAHQARGTNAA